MNKADLLNMAWHNLLRHKGRTFLTVLGVMIGVTAIIVMISLALGLTEHDQHGRSVGQLE